MSKAEEFIKNHTNNQANISIEISNGGEMRSYSIPWLTLEDTRKAVKIAREEMFEWLEKNIYMYNGECEGDKKEIINDLKQAMKDE